MTARTTHKAMIVVGLLVWLVAIAWPGWSMPGLLLGAVMVAWASFGLIDRGVGARAHRRLPSDTEEAETRIDGGVDTG